MRSLFGINIILFSALFLSTLYLILFTEFNIFSAIAYCAITVSGLALSTANFLLISKGKHKLWMALISLVVFGSTILLFYNGNFFDFAWNYVLGTHLFLLSYGFVLFIPTYHILNRIMRYTAFAMTFALTGVIFFKIDHPAAFIVCGILLVATTLLAIIQPFTRSSSNR